MVDQKIHQTLAAIVQSTEELYKENKQKKTERIEAKLQALLNERGNLDPSEIQNLLREANVLDKVANYADNLADQYEKNKQEKRKLAEIKEALMHTLGIPAQFVEQLSILIKGGPEALREAAQVYRAKAKELREASDIALIGLHRLDREIKLYTEIKEAVMNKNVKASMSISEYLTQIRYRETLRDKSDSALKEMLKQIEGSE